MTFPLEWAERLVPRPGHIFIERDEPVSLFRGTIFIPDRVVQGTKSQVATVVAAGMGVCQSLVGARVLTAAGVGRLMVFGERRERTLWACRPEELLVRFHEEFDEITKKDQRLASGRYPIPPIEKPTSREEGRVLRPVE
jgi:hypothetical protein